MEKEKKKEIEKEDIMKALENLFVSGYVHMKMYKDGEVGLFMDGNSDLMESGELLFHVSLQELLEGFVEDTSISFEDVKSLRTRNSKGVSFRDYLMAVAQELYDGIELYTMILRWSEWKQNTN
jgi:hypothetical protein